MSGCSMYGQISGQVPNQFPQQNGNPMQPAQMQNLAGVGGGGAGIPVGGSPANMFARDLEFQSARLYMRERIFAIILQRQSQPVNEAQKQKFKEISRRLEEGLLKSAQTKDEYINQSTLESRLSNLINQRRVQLVNSSSSVSTMIPTPGMSHSGNSNLMASSVDTMMISSAGNDSIAPTVNTGMLSSGGMHGTLSNGYQQSPGNFPK